MDRSHECIEPGDPRYDGSRMRELWVLCAIDPADNQEGIVHVPPEAAFAFHLDIGPAFASDEPRADRLREYASWLAAGRAQVRTRLRHFVIADEEAFGA